MARSGRLTWTGGARAAGANPSVARLSPAPVRVLLVTGLAVLSAAIGGCGHGSPSTTPPSSQTSPPTTVSEAGAPAASASVVGLTLSGVGSHLKRPGGPTNKPYSNNCHALLDPAFHGSCIIASGPNGTVVGEVEEEQGALLTQERDVVWRRAGSHWALALVHVAYMCRNGLACTASPGLPTLLWRDDIERDHLPQLVFALPTDRPGYSAELDIVDEEGKVSLVRFLGEGFVNVTTSGRIVAYVPGSSESNPADGFFDQTLIARTGAHWRVLSEQYVPYAAALAQHKGAFWDPKATMATSK